MKIRTPSQTAPRTTPRTERRGQGQKRNSNGVVKDRKREPKRDVERLERAVDDQLNGVGDEDEVSDGEDEGGEINWIMNDEDDDQGSPGEEIGDPTAANTDGVSTDTNAPLTTKSPTTASASLPLADPFKRARFRRASTDISTPQAIDASIAVAKPPTTGVPTVVTAPPTTATPLTDHVPPLVAQKTAQGSSDSASVPATVAIPPATNAPTVPKAPAVPTVTVPVVDNAPPTTKPPTAILPTTRPLLTLPPLTPKPPRTVRLPPTTEQPTKTAPETTKAPPPTIPPPTRLTRLPIPPPPPKILVHFIRHAKAVQDLDRHGNTIRRPDPPLSDRGHRQSADIRLHFPRDGVTHILTSPLQRTLDTALRIFYPLPRESPPLKIQIVPALRPVPPRTLFNTVTNPRQLQALCSKGIYRNAVDWSGLPAYPNHDLQLPYHARMPVMKGMLNVLCEDAAREGRGLGVVVVGHGSAMNELFWGMGFEEMEMFESWRTYRVEGGRWALVELEKRYL